ncbi:MAG: hypothetical protein ACXVJE_19395 [Mucilaginibacter sp.]
MSNAKRTTVGIVDHAENSGNKAHKLPAENNEQQQGIDPASIAENGDVAGKNDIETAENNENMPISYYPETFEAVVDDTTTLYTWQLEELVKQNIEYKTDIITLVNIFRMFAGVTTNPLKIVGAVSKIMADDEAKARLNVAIELIEKYTENNG